MTKSIPQIPGAHYVLIVGETGTGKSTFVNTIVNRFRNGNLTDAPRNIRVAIPTKFLEAKEPEARDSSEKDKNKGQSSQTMEATAYVLKDSDLGTFVLIDTPGLADTRGIEQDDNNVGIILDAAKECPSLSCIILTLNGTNCRFGLSITTTLSRLRGSIPDVALNNMVFCLNNTDKRSSSNFDIEQVPFQPKAVVYMNNAFFSSDPKNWDEDDLDCMQLLWIKSMWCIEELTKEINLMGKVCVDDFAQMKKQRDVVKSVLHEGRLHVEELQKIQNDILDIEALMRRQKDDTERFKDYTSSKQVTTTESVDTDYHSTICSKCNKVCHENCGLEKIASQGDQRFNECAAFSGNQHCQVCGGETRCDYSTHYHDSKILKQVTSTLDHVLEDVKADFDKATAGLAKSTIDSTKLNDAKKLIEVSIKKCTKDILDSCQAIKGICKGFNFAEEMHTLLQQLEAGRMLLTDPYAKATAQTFIDSIKGIITGLAKDSYTLLAVVKKGPYREILFKGTPARAAIMAAPSCTTGTTSPALPAISETTFLEGCWCTKCEMTHTSIFACPRRTGGCGNN